jgi:hypothetical protein
VSDMLERLYQAHSATESGTLSAYAWLKSTVGTDNQNERDASRELFEKNAWALYVLDEIIYGKARDLIEILRSNGQNA